MSKVLIVGGGAAGMMAAISSAENGCEVHLYEKNEKLGKKLYITGKGRCNITNASDMDVVINNIVCNSKFMYSSLYTFTNDQVVDFFEEVGVPTKIERGNRVFPTSDKSSDVIKGLTKKLKSLGVYVHLNAEVNRIIEKGSVFEAIGFSDGSVEKGDKVIIATGGFSYPTTGSTGDGYKFAKKMGHTITELSPALVPLVIKEDYAIQLQGLSLKNVEARIVCNKKELYSGFGEMLFTHFGVSGPLILSSSSYVVSHLKKNEMKLILDLKPALSIDMLDKRILRDFEETKNKNFRNAIEGLLPKKMTPIIIEYSKIDPNKKVNEITKEERMNLVRSIKEFTMTITGVRGYNEAIITRGGINVKEINPSTLESKKVKNVYFVGEVIDIDALTGGYNLQIAWSTGYLAGKCE